jgi:hypothetical protein
VAQTVSLKANAADARHMIVDRRGRLEGDPAPQPAITASIDLSTMDGAAELSSAAVEVTCLLVAGTPAAGQLPASSLIGGGKPFASAQEAAAWRDKLLAIYQALRAAKGWE